MNPKVRDRILQWFRAGLAAVEPQAVTRDALQKLDLGQGKIIVLAFGKAAVPMAAAAREVIGTRHHAGLLVTKQGQFTKEIEGFTSIESAHPIPDDRSLRAGEMALDLVKNLSSSDTVIALISGGGSALIEQPIEGVSLMDMQVTTELLMYAGADIGQLNTVRKALSQIKGGGLRRAIAPANCVTLMLSDVLGNSHSVIASGPTVPAPTNRSGAWKTITRFGLDRQVPESVRHALTSEHAPDPLTEFPHDHREVISDNQTFVKAIAAAIEADGLIPEHTWHEWGDSSRTLASEVLKTCNETAFDVIIGGGEATSEVTGNGKGGRNTDAGLRVAIGLREQGVNAWTFASLASDGDDGNSGAAGAIVDADSVVSQSDAEKALAESDSAGYLEKANALVVTGQSGTNVNDVYIAVRTSAISGEKT